MSSDSRDTSRNASNFPAASPVERQPDAQIGNYRLDKTIGQGTYGKVKLGVNITNGEKVAIKVIEKGQIQSQKQVARLQREIRFLKLLHHPHIVKVHDVIETSEFIYIVMEYAAGGELFDYIVAHKRVKEKEARSFFRMVLSAVDYCHKNAVIHRDLKPENLLLDESKRIKIIDFGFGNNYTLDGLLDTFCGSPFYAAPEMILGKKYEGPEVDMWSLGVILFALLCGHLPFDDDNMRELYKKIASGSYACPDYLLPTARHLIGRLITVDPKERATLDEVLHHPWVNDGYMHPPLNYLPERLEIRDPSQLSKDIVNRLTAFGYKVDDIFRAFNETTDYSKPEAIRSTYFLLVEMLQREETRMKAERRRSLAMALEAGKRLQPKFHSANSLDEASRDSTAVSSQISLSIGNDSCRRVNQPIGETKYQSETALLDTAQRIGPLSTKEVHAPQRRYESMQAISCETEYCIEKGLPPTAIQRPAAALTAKFSPSRPCRPQTSAPNGNWTAQRQIPQTYRQGEKDGFQFDESDSMDVSCATLSESMADLTTGAGVTNGGLKPIVDVERPSTAMANMIRASKDYSPGPGADDLRSVSGWFLNISATSTKTPKQIIIEILRVLTECRVPYVHDDKFTIVCEVDAGVVLGGTSPDYGELVEKGGVSKANLISFQIEVCRIPKMGMFGLHFKRISGGVWNYKKCCNRLLSLMSL